MTNSEAFKLICTETIKFSVLQNKIIMRFALVFFSQILDENSPHRLSKVQIYF